MKILELTNGYPTNEAPLRGIFERDQALALKNIGEEVTICAIDMRSFRHRRKYGISCFSDNGVDVYKCDLPLGAISTRLLNKISWFIFKKALSKVIEEKGKPDIIHAHFGRATGYLALKAKQKMGIDYIITEHDSSVNKDLVSKKDRELLYNIYITAKERIAVSPTFCKRLNNIYGVQFKFIPNIVDSKAFLGIDKNAHDGINFVSVGGLIERKGMDVLIKAFNKIKDDKNIGNLTIIGDGPKRETLKKLTESLDISDRVKFTGVLTRDKIAENFSESDIFVLASRNETFGVVYIEAMCAGLPVIATRCGGPEGLFTKDEGLYVDVDDVDGLSNAMLEIANNLDRYKAEQIKEFCLSNFSPEVVAKKITNLINFNN